MSSTNPGSPPASITLARVTSLDHTSYCHFLRPSTPHSTRPVCKPTRMFRLTSVASATDLQGQNTWRVGVRSWDQIYICIYSISISRQNIRRRHRRCIKIKHNVTHNTERFASSRRSNLLCFTGEQSQVRPQLLSLYIYAQILKPYCCYNIRIFTIKSKLYVKWLRSDTGDTHILNSE